MNNSETVTKSKPEFNKFQAAVWPIHGYEMKKFLPMSLMMFFILFVYTLVRDLKDTLVVSTAHCGGAECIPAIKLWGVMPIAVIALIIFAKLVNKFDSQKVFYIIITFFMAFYALFGFVLFPLSNSIHMSEATIEALRANTIPALRSFMYYKWPLIGNWSYSLFYILSELWGSLVISALFWQFANQITKKTEVKRFYGLFACIGNFGLIFSGSLVKFLGGNTKKAEAAGVKNAFQTNVMWQMFFVLLAASAILGLYTYINKCILTDSRFYDPALVAKKKEKPKMGIGESIKCIFTSPYLLLICVLVMGYGIAINLSEVVWKAQGKLYYGSSHAFNQMMGNLSITTGLVTIFITLTASNLLRKCSWRTAALITPISVLVLGGLFFGIVWYENVNGVNANLFGFNVLALAVGFGLVQDALSKGIKYSLFDTTKQMTYIPLDPDLKTKGQAAVEVIGGRLGKAGGSLINETLLSIFAGATMTGLVGIIAPIVLIVVGLWTGSVFGLNKKYTALLKQRETEEATATTSKEVKEEATAAK